jgi:hypothetical protein
MNLQLRSSGSKGESTCAEERANDRAPRDAYHECAHDSPSSSRIEHVTNAAVVVQRALGGSEQCSPNGGRWLHADFISEKLVLIIM